MSFFKKLKSLFIVEEEIKSSGDPYDTKEQNSGQNVSEEETQKFLDILIAAIERNNLEGFDYLEFMQSIDNIKDQAITEDEVKIYQTAFSIANTLGLDKSKLLESGRYYLSVLEKEKSHFNDALNNNAKRKLKEKLSELKDAEKSNKEFIAQMEALKEKIQKKEQEIDSLKEELMEADAKIKAVMSGFTKAHEAMKSKINSDIDKIEKYL
jgi:hypothetical protein